VAFGGKHDCHSDCIFTQQAPIVIEMGEMIRYANAWLRSFKVQPKLQDCSANQSPVSLFWHNLTNFYSPNGNSKNIQKHDG